MLKISDAKLSERALMKRVEKAVLKELGQDDIFETSVSVVSAEEIKRVNAEARNVDKVTDVLSFPYFEALRPPVRKEDFCDADMLKGRVMLGYILICRERAEQQAEELGHSYARELGFLTCHGLLHLMGFDHIQKDDEEVMTALQRAVMQRTGLKG